MTPSLTLPAAPSERRDAPAIESIPAPVNAAKTAPIAVAVAPAVPSEEFAWIERVATVMQAAANGNLEVRADGVRPTGPGGMLFERTNHLLDLTDAFVREATGALSSASRGRFFRKVLRRGMSGTFHRAAGVINGAIDEMAKQSDALKAAEAERGRLADRFEESVRGVVERVVAAATQARAGADVQVKSSERTSSVATTVAAASEENSVNVKTVAAATEELSASAREIHQQVERSASIARAAAERTEQTTRVMGELSSVSERIGDIVKLISGIAGQTNLLALNAAIEAARAGTAGRGFAVVASEVKALAQETARATEAIAAQIEAIRSKVAESGKTLGSVAQTIGEMNEIATAVASAVNEQGAATTEISRNLQQLATGTQEVSRGIGQVSEVARDSCTAAGEMLTTADRMVDDVRELTGAVDDFLSAIRGGGSEEATR
ncbi:MAG: hypothetical protein JNL90_07125 [Planctomycetes bacterium]|nr:hypothetical protein [Planctomycetota bacterium]